MFSGIKTCVLATFKSIGFSEFRPRLVKKNIPQGVKTKLSNCSNGSDIEISAAIVGLSLKTSKPDSNYTTSL